MARLGYLCRSVTNSTDGIREIAFARFPPPRRIRSGTEVIMEILLKNYRHDVYPVSLYLILKQIYENIEQLGFKTGKNAGCCCYQKYVKKVIDKIDEVNIKGGDASREFCKKALKCISEYIEFDTWDYYASIVMAEICEQV